MFFIDCGRCGVSFGGSPRYAKELGWDLDGDRDLCPRCVALPEDWDSVTTTVDVSQARAIAHDVIVKIESAGFDRPENGSMERYQERRKSRPWASHTLWWVLHNVVAHPLIGLLPFGPFFRFHDWTSERMHGVG